MSDLPKFTDQELADWVPKNQIPEGEMRAARAAGISSRVMAVIKTIRAQYENKETAHE